MSKLIRAAAISCAFSCFAIAPAFAAENAKHPWNQGVPFESATISYEMTGTDPGTKILYIRARGDERATVTRSHSADSANPNERHTIEISTPSELTRLEMSTKTGLRGINKLGFYLEAYKKLGDDDKAKIMKVIAEPQNRFPALRGRPAPVAGKSEFLGFKCDVVEIGAVISHYIEGTTILLKSEGVEGTFQVATVATKVDTKSPIPAEVFSLPEGVRVRDMRELQTPSNRAAAEKEIAALLAPHP